jgi:hypothetical protein
MLRRMSVPEGVDKSIVKSYPSFPFTSCPPNLFRMTANNFFAQPSFRRLLTGSLITPEMVNSLGPCNDYVRSQPKEKPVFHNAGPFA